MYQRFMHDWERRCHNRDNNRVVRPFDWGIEFLDRQFMNGHRPDEYARIIDHFNKSVISNSQKFFVPPKADAGQFEFDGFRVRFPSAIQTPYPRNNTVHARYFAAERNGSPSDCAVIVMPQWNGDEQAHVSICKGLNFFGISALRLSLPYHDQRKPEELVRADYLVSSNIGRTIQSVRQSVMDIIRAADWLETQGIKRIGLMGTSVGSCVGFLSFVHEERFKVGVFNHVSSYFGDVVWQGITTAHIRKSLEEHLTREQVREAWMTISPSAYIRHLRDHDRKFLLMSAKYDLTFPYDLSQIVFEDCDRLGIKHDRIILPCGHYTSGKTPFKFKVGYHIVNYFRKAWREPKEGGRR